VHLPPSCPGLACSHGACTKSEPSIAISIRQTLPPSTTLPLTNTRHLDSQTGEEEGESEKETRLLYSTPHTHTHASPHPRTHAQPPHNCHCHCHLFTATCIASPGLSRCTPLAHFVFSRRIPLGSTPTLAPAPCSHPSTTRTTAVVSSHTEATHWRCTGVGRMLSTRRWADPETTNTAHSFRSPYTRSRNTPERH
jgi:hypothetical protein